MATRIASRHRAGFGALALALALAGCSDTQRPWFTAPREPRPVAYTPALAVRALEWCWDHRDAPACADLFTEDFLFQCSITDSAGSTFRDRVLTRLEEIEVTRHLLAGGGAQPPANYVSLQLDHNLISVPDTRPGKGDSRFHQMIPTSVVLRIDTLGDDFQVTGAARFFLVRGDSALLPPAGPGGRPGPDSTRWYIQRWEDETLGTAGISTPADDAAASQTMPPAKPTWCHIKALYR